MDPISSKRHPAGASAGRAVRWRGPPGRDRTGPADPPPSADRDPAGDATRIDLAGIPFLSPLVDVPPRERVRVVVVARDVALALTDPAGVSFQKRLPMRIAALEPRADGVLVRLEAGGLRLKALVTRQAGDQLALAPGARVIALVKATPPPATPERGQPRVGRAHSSIGP